MSALPVPPEADRKRCYAPLVALLRDHLIAPKALAARWSYTDDHLSNLRRAGNGLPFVRLPLGPKGMKGGIRYRLSDVIGAELDGSFGAVSLERVAMAIAACAAISEDQRAAVIAHLREALA